MNSINFFKKKKLKISKLFPKSKFKKDILIEDVKPLNTAKKNDLTFFDSIKYKDFALNTKAKFCVTTINSEKFLPKNRKNFSQKCLLELSNITQKNLSNSRYRLS